MIIINYLAILLLILMAIACGSCFEILTVKKIILDIIITIISLAIFIYYWYILNTIFSIAYGFITLFWAYISVKDYSLWK